MPTFDAWWQAVVSSFGQASPTPTVTQEAMLGRFEAGYDAYDAAIEMMAAGWARRAA